MKSCFLNFTLIWIIFCCAKSTAQGTIKDYLNSISVDTLFADKVFNSPSNFNWTNDNLLWYVNNNRTGNEYLLVSYKEKSQKAAFDHTQLAKSLSILLGKNFTPDKLDLKDLKFSKDLSSLTFTCEGIIFSAQLDTYELKKEGVEKNENGHKQFWPSFQNESKNDSIESPDKAYVAYIKNSNLHVQDNNKGEEIQLSFDGSNGFFYSSNIYWSPDSSKIIAYKLLPRQEHKVHYIESSPSNQLQPKLISRDYLKPGDQLDFKSPQLFHIKTKQQIYIPTELFQEQYNLSNFVWNDNGNRFTFEYNQRGHQKYRVLSVDADTGKISIVIEESSSTFIDYSGKKFRHDNENGDIIWASERDGWNHLYLFDKTGKFKNQITKGQWPLRDVIKVDEENKQIYFTASGTDEDQDPYFIHYFRIDFDGRNLTRFTKENGNHMVVFSSDYQYYVDQFSRVDMAPITLLKNAKTQKTIMELQISDYADLMATGWKAPEPFTAKGRDNETDIWGIIVRPTTFDPNKNYPIIEYIYAGPHDSFVPKDFSPFYVGMSSLAELGFIVVKIDGMGTSNRSKKFHDVAWKNLKDAGFPDRKLWIKAAAKKYPYMDIEKVGIHGRSAGGQSSSGALIFNSDFYDVAVSSSGCHDNRMDKIWWNEQWMGYPIGPQYIESSNIENAEKLKGNLLLIVGELDTNVDPASTFQFVDALIKANKDFELVVRPGVGHSAGNDEYDNHKRKDFFVKHLMGVIPPKWDEIDLGEDNRHSSSK